jgi:hypothetical protein
MQHYPHPLFKQPTPSEALNFPGRDETLATRFGVLMQ